MSFLTEKELTEIQKLSTESKEKLKKSKIVGCYSCTSIFDYNEIDEFVNFGGTALCPYCGIDAVVPLLSFNLNQQRLILNELNKKFFQEPSSELIIPINREEDEKE